MERKKTIFKFYKYKTVKFLIEQGKINRIDEIFQYVAKTRVLADFRINFGRFNAALANPMRFRLEELKALADLFHVDPKILIDLAYAQALTAVRHKRKYPHQQKSDAIENPKGL